MGKNVVREEIRCWNAEYDREFCSVKAEFTFKGLLNLQGDFEVVIYIMFVFW